MPNARRLLLSALTFGLLSTSSLLAQTTSKVGELTYLSNAEVQQHAQKLLKAAATSPGGASTEVLYNFGSYYLLLVARTHTGDAELHQDWADQIVMLSGEVTFVVGGTMNGSHPSGTDHGEFRGPSIDGGKSQILHAGDVVRVPVNIPHWAKVTSQGPVTYMCFKSK